MQLETTPVRPGSGMPDEMLTALHAAATALETTPRPSPVHGTLAQWAEVVAAAQRVANMAMAVQDEALVSLAAIESEVLEDGTVVQSHRAPGHIALDAPAIASGALSVSALHAEQRVRAAVRLAADGPAGSPTATGLRALHEAMASGRLDSYRAGVLADELEQAPAEVAAAVVQALSGYVDHETGPQLRARCRRVLASISPDLLRQRASRAREQCGLRRWAQEPGVDQWEGTFPSEDAARAWAAIDARAQELRADGTCTRIDRARAQALIDLVTGSATITTVLTLTVPAATAGGDPAASTDTTDDAAATSDANRTPAGVHAAATSDANPTTAEVDTAPAGGANWGGREAEADVADASGAPASWTTDDDAQGLPSSAAKDVRAGSTEIASPRSFGGAPAGPSPDDLVEVTLSGNPQPVLVTRTFLDVVARALEAQTVNRGCHPDSGALLGSAGSAAYRPPAAVAALVRQRDGRCRFPGCHVNARFCDLDHVRPWPTGPTDAANLICLCRRHHRIKQRHGWRVRLTSDGQCTWTDPTGRTLTTSAIDALHTLVLPAPAPEGADEPSSRPVEPCSSVPEVTTADTAALPPGDRFSTAEFALEHALVALPPADRIGGTDQRHSSACRAEGGCARGPARPRIDLHRPHEHRHPSDQFVVADTWPHAAAHHTRLHRRSAHAWPDGEPPF